MSKEHASWKEKQRHQRKKLSTKKQVRSRSSRSHRSLRTTRDYQGAARGRLKSFRQGSILAVSITALLLVVTQSGDAQVGASNASDSVAEATGTVRELLASSYAILPKLGIGLVLIVMAALLSKLIKKLLAASLVRWEKATAIASLASIGLYIAAIAAALSIIAGDVRALMGSLGLIGLALSWALQTPIESFTGWLLNSFRSYYRVGDRIAVGEVFGDVYRVDLLTTTVWEAGGSGKPVAGAQSTGALVTFPNWEVLRSNITNYSQDFPYVWDEVSIGVANESDLRYCVALIERVGEVVMGELMRTPAEQYRALLKREGLNYDVDDQPRVFVSLTDSWVNCTLRYLVPARSRRKWATDLLLAINEEAAKPEHKGRFIGAYPRSEVLVSRPKRSEARSF